MRIVKPLTPELEKEIEIWWSDLEYLKKIRILLLAYQNLNITKIESQSYGGVAKLWRKIPLEQRKNFYEDGWKY